MFCCVNSLFVCGLLMQEKTIMAPSEFLKSFILIQCLCMSNDNKYLKKNPYFLFLPAACIKTFSTYGVIVLLGKL